MGAPVWVWLSQFAALAYQARKESEEDYRKRVTALLEHSGWSEIAFVAHAGTQAFIAKRDHVVVVSFRGTESELADIRSDLRGWRIRSSIGTVHAGSKDALDRIWLKLRDEILSRTRGTQDVVYLTGHSLGGMIANVCASYLIDEAIRVGAIVTYGTPPTGNVTFARVMGYLLRGKAYRVVNQSDYVPRILTQKALGYFHFGDLIYIDTFGTTRVNPPFIGRLCDMHKRPCNAIPNHAMRSYRRTLSQLEGSYETDQ